MNRFKYAEEKPMCKLCNEHAAVKYKMCDYCVGLYLTYYNYVIKQSGNRVRPNTPEQFLEIKLKENNEQV